MLSELIEKKDLVVYLKLRRIELKENMKRIPDKEVPKKRETARRKMKGRIAEINSLLNLANSNKFNEKGKKLWISMHEKGLVKKHEIIK